MQTLEEKIERLREISKDLKEYDNCLFLYESDRIDISILKEEVFDIIATL